MELISFDNKDAWLELRTRDITSTEVSALFGLNPYMTELELWHQKKNKEVVSISDNERMAWGRALEHAIAEKFAEEQDWQVEPFDDYGRVEDLRMGSSFDYRIMDQDTYQLLEIKNVDWLQYRDKWMLDDEGQLTEAPPHIELQVQHQLAVTGYETAYLGALISGNSGKLLKRKPTKVIQDDIKEKVSKFWWTIENDKPPKPDYERDHDFISKLYSQSNEGMVIDATNDLELEQLCFDYKTCALKEKEWTTKKKVLKAKMLEKIGAAEKVLGMGWSINAKTTKDSFVEAYTRKGYRGFRVNIKKPKGIK